MTAVADVETQEPTPMQAAPAAKSAPLMSQRQIRLVIYALMAGMFLSSLDQTIVGTAIRTIGDDLHGLDQQAWVTTAYLIAATVTTPLYGKLSDIFGRRPLFIVSISIFLLGSFLSSFSTSMLMLAAFRAVQGLGAGGLMSLPLAIIGDMLAPRERAKYQGYFLATFGIAAVVGPLVGGMFAGADTILGITGWRWVFLVNVPVGLVALVMVIAFLHLPHTTSSHPRIDWAGAGLVVATLAPLLLVAEQGREWGFTSPIAITCYVIGGVGLIAFILVERAMGSAAIIPLRLFSAKGFSPAIVLSVLVGFGMFGAMMTLPLYLQIVVGLDPTQSGFATLPMMGGIMTASVVSGQVVARTGKYGIFPITGTATMVVGFGILTQITIDKPLVFLLVAMFIVGLGLGQLMQTLTMAVQAATPAADIGVATSSATFFRQIGGTLGTAIMLSMLFNSLPANVANSLTDKATTTAALDAALDPAVATNPANQGIMDQMWTPVTTKITDQVNTNLDDATDQVNTQVEAKVREKVTDAVHKKAAEGTGKLADGLDSLSTGLDKLSDGTGAFVSGVGQIGSGASQLAGGLAKVEAASGQLSTGLTKLAAAEKTAASSAKKSTTDYTALAKAMQTMGTDQKACSAGDTDACDRLSADNSAVQNAMTALATSVYTTNGYLNGASGKPGLATGLTQAASGSTQLTGGLGKLSDGAHQLATGANTAASKGSQLTAGASAAASGTAKMTDGARQLSTVDTKIDAAVEKALPDAQKKALEKVAEEKNLSVIDGKLAVDYSDATQRQAIVDSIVPGFIDALNDGDTSKLDSDASASDTSFLTGADPRLTKPFLTAFNSSVVSIYWIGLGVMLLAFVVTLFYRVPPLRTRSAMEEKSAALESLG